MIQHRETPRRALLAMASVAIFLIAVLIWIWLSASPAKGPHVAVSPAGSRSAEPATESPLVGVGEDLSENRSRTSGTDSSLIADASAEALPLAADPAQNGTVTVVVRWEDSGEPASGVMVYLKLGSGSGSLFRPARRMTNGAGRAEFASVQPGEHRVAIHSSPSERRVPVQVDPASAQEVELLIPMGISISGVVLSAEGEQVPGAELVWMDMFGEADVIMRSDDSGAFVIRGILDDGALFARHPDEAPSVKRRCRLSDGSQRDVVFRLRGPGASIEGLVRNESGAPVPGARVSLGTIKEHIEGPHGSEDRNLNRPARVRALTDEQGHFEFTGVAPIEWLLLVDRREYAPIEETVLLSPGASESVSITLTAGGTVHGTITDAKGAPVEGVSVFTWKNMKAGLRFSRLTRTDPAGAYELGGLPRLPGLPFRAVRTGTPDAADARLDLDVADRVEWSPTVSAPSGLSGIVVGRFGEPLAKLTVVALGPQGWMDVALTGVDGGFSLGEDLKTARDICIMRPSQPGRPQNPALPLHLEKDVLPASSPLVIQITEEDLAAGSIEGQVIDAEGRIPSGAQFSVELWGYPVATTTSFRADGSFAIEEIPVGAFELRFSAPDRADWMGRVTVEAGKSSDLGEIHSGPGGMFRWEPASLETSGWPDTLSVIASHAGGGESKPFPLQAANDQGPLASGVYTFRFAAEGYAFAEASAQVRDGETTLVAVPRAEAQEGATFLVVGASEGWIQGKVTHAAGAIVHSTGFGSDGAPHELVLPGLVDGKYVLHLESYDQRTATHPFEIRAGFANPKKPTVTLR